jgi:FkbM family methyltransferase
MEAIKRDLEQRDLTKVTFRGIDFLFGTTITLPGLVQEIFGDCYRIFDRGMKFGPGDLVLDIGANEGLFAIMMAKCFPGVRVIALEPVAGTYGQMVRNLKLNDLDESVVKPLCVGVGGTERNLDLVCSKDYSGGSTACGTFKPADHVLCPVRVVTLDGVLDEYVGGRVALLKMDIEGMEYEALYASTCLDRVDTMVAEFHINEKLRAAGRDINELATWVGARTRLVFYDRVVMCE